MENGEYKYKIRPLTRGDRVRVTAMMAKLADKIGGSGIIDVIKSGAASAAATSGGQSGSGPANRNDQALNIGMKIIQLIVVHLESDIAEWFASLLGKTVAELNAMPPDVDIEIIEQLKKSEAAKDFFSRALRMYSGIGTSGAAPAAVSTASSSTPA